MLIDRAAYANRLRWAHPAEKAGFAGLCMAASLVARSPWVSLGIVAICSVVALGAARLPFRTWLALCALPTGSCWPAACRWHWTSVAVSRISRRPAFARLSW